MFKQSRTPGLGVNVAFHHPDDYHSPVKGFTLNGNENIVVSATIEKIRNVS